MAERIIDKNRALYKEAQAHLVGGVDSPVRAFGYALTDPVLIKRGKGAAIYDYDGNKYIDYVLSWGSAILGHAHSAVVKDARRAIADGASFGTTNSREIELARLIQSAIPFVENIRFVNSGTEAVMSAIRLARGYTKKNKILKFANSYHGHADYLLAKSGSGLATLGIPSSAGVPEDFTKHTLIASSGDMEAVKNLFKKYKGDIAAVIVEPVGGNYGVIPPDIKFLKSLRKITDGNGALLIFDEVVTGFRFGFGSAAQKFGIIPDLICLGKIIGGGLPIGAYGGKRETMERLAPLGDVYQASTFAGNPVVMQSGLSALAELRKRKRQYLRLEKLARKLSYGLEKEARKQGVDLKVTRYGGTFSLKFGKKRDFQLFYAAMLDDGIYFAPSEFEANFLSFAHTEEDIAKTIRAAKGSFKIVKEARDGRR